MRIFQVTEAEGDKCEICRGRGKIDYHSEDGPSKCQKCNGKGVQAWKPEPVNWGNDKVKEDEVIQELTPGDRGVERNRRSAPVKPKLSNADMGARDNRAVGKQKRTQKAIDTQASNNRVKATQQGDVGGFAKQRTFKNSLKNAIVSDPNGVVYQYQPQEQQAKMEPNPEKEGEMRPVLDAEGQQVTEPNPNGRYAWRAIELKGPGQKVQPGEKKAWEPEKDIITDLPGTYPLKDTDGVAQDLMAIAKGVEPTTGLAQSMKDRATKAMGGPLATKTMQDPDASTAAKVGGIAGAALGRLASKAIKRPTVAVAKPDLPTQGNHMNDINMHQKGMVDQSKEAGERIKHAQEFLNVLKKHDVKYDVDKYVQAITPAIKRSGLQKAAPEFYGQFVKQVRAMRTEAYEYANELLEAAGLTWEQVGYTVSLHEGASDVVFLTPITALTELTEQIQLQDLKKLAGMQ